MLVAPYDQIHPFGNHTFVDTILAASSIVSVLMKDKYVEEVVSPLLGRGANKFNLFQIPHSIQALVSHSSQTIQSHMCWSLAEKNGSDFNVIDLICLAEVVD